MSEWKWTQDYDEDIWLQLVEDSLQVSPRFWTRMRYSGLATLADVDGVVDCDLDDVAEAMGYEWVPPGGFPGIRRLVSAGLLTYIGRATGRYQLMMAGVGFNEESKPGSRLKERALRRVCPKCHATGGIKCRGVRGRPRTAFHRERLYSW